MNDQRFNKSVRRSWKAFNYNVASYREDFLMRMVKSHVKGALEETSPTRKKAWSKDIGQILEALAETREEILIHGYQTRRQVLR